MTLREKINQVVNSETELDKGLLVLSLLDGEGLGLDGNGWLDDDEVASEHLWSDDVRNELDRIFG